MNNNNDSSNQMSLKDLKLKIRKEIGTTLIVCVGIPGAIGYLLMYYFKDSVMLSAIGLLLVFLACPIGSLIFYRLKLSFTRKYITKENHKEILKLIIPYMILIYLFFIGGGLIANIVTLICLIIIITLYSPEKKS